MKDVKHTGVAGFELKLDHHLYEGVDANIRFEVRDFGQTDRVLVVRSDVGGQVVTTLVSWAQFTDAFDQMRGNMMSEDWDEALTLLTGRS